MKWLAAVVFALTLSACTATDVLSFFKPDKGLSVETEIVAGDKEEQVNTQVGNKQEVIAERVEGGVNTNNITDTSPWVLLLLVLGWMMPWPSTIWEGLKRWRGVRDE